MDLRKLTTADVPPRRGLLAFEWVVLAYLALTTGLMAVYGLHHELNVAQMLVLRGQTVVAIIALWLIYRWRPCRLTLFLRVAVQMALLSRWYPDTYELNRILPNLDHVFASWEQSLFGCQPALLLAAEWPQPLVSELLEMGYASYFFLMVVVCVYYLLHRYADFTRMAFILLGSFYLFYLVFIFLPVAGPQYYYCAVGTGQIAQGIFPDLGHYFQNHQECLPIPGWQDGLFHHLVGISHNAGERPTAAFPSSHVGITVVLLWLARQARSRRLLLGLLPFAVLMFFGTFYVQAHYVIDAIAGLLAGTLFYFLLKKLTEKLHVL